MNDCSSVLDKAVDLLEQADGLLITAGAGMSVDSGLPDYRSPGGYWNEYPPLKELGMTYIKSSNPRNFITEPSLAWGIHGHRINRYRDAMPHEGFGMLFEIGRRIKNGFFVYTSNVDGQFQKAGCHNNSIVEAHGSMLNLQCSKPCCSDIWPVGDCEFIIDESNFHLLSDIPLCTRCGTVARPNVLMFDDNGWVGPRRAEQELNFQSWVRKCSQPVIIEVGAGTAIQTIRHLSQSGLGKVIRINPGEYKIDHSIEDGIGIGMRGINAIWELHSRYY